MQNLPKRKLKRTAMFRGKPSKRRAKQLWKLRQKMDERARRPYWQLYQWLRKKADNMRANPTPAERAVRGFFDRSKVIYCCQKPLIFRTSQGFKGYIVDFYLFEAQAVIEVDGEHHAYQQACYDAVRTRRIEGVNPFPKTVTRITNQQAKDKDFTLLLPFIK